MKEKAKMNLLIALAARASVGERESQNNGAELLT